MTRCDGSPQALEQVGPASGVCVASRHDGTWQRPRDCKINVVVSNCQVLGRIMLSIDPVTHVGARGQCLEAVQEARRHIKVPKFRVIEQEGFMPTETGRIFPGIHEHVVHSAICTSNQLAFTSPRAAVESTDDAPPRARLRILHERGRPAGSAYEVVEDHGVEGPCEEAALVPKRFGDKYKDVCKGGRFDSHLEMLT